MPSGAPPPPGTGRDGGLEGVEGDEVSLDPLPVRPRAADLLLQVEDQPRAGRILPIRTLPFT